MPAPPLRFDAFELDPQARALTCDGRPVRLGARAFDVLLTLAQARGAIVSRDALMQAVWGDEHVGDNNLNVQVSALRKRLGRDAIVTVAGRGLRFARDLHEGGARPAPADRPSVAVLPFRRSGPAGDADWLAPAASEDIADALARFRGLFVLGQGTVAALTAQDGPSPTAPPEPRRLAQALGVRYVVEGSVRAVASRLVIRAELIDAADGGRLWSETCEHDARDHFEALDALSGRLAAALAPQIDGAERREARRLAAGPEDLDAYAAARRAWSLAASGEAGPDPAPRDEAVALAARALAADPTCAVAWRAAAAAHWWNAYHRTAPDPDEALAQALGAAQEALSLDVGDHHAWRIRGLCQGLAQRPEAALADLRRAHDLNPNCALTLAWRGMYEATHGDVAAGAPCAEDALRLSPCDPSRWAMLLALGFARFAAGDCAGAAQAAEEAAQIAPGAPTAQLLRAIGWTGAGRADLGAQAFAALEAMAPALAADRLAGRWLGTNEDYVRRADRFLRAAAAAAETGIESVPDQAPAASAPRPRPSSLPRRAGGAL